MLEGPSVCNAEPSAVASLRPLMSRELSPAKPEKEILTTKGAAFWARVVLKLLQKEGLAHPATEGRR